jgi:hypothetical protein
MTPQLQGWFARQYRRAVALDDLEAAGCDPDLLRFARWLYATGRMSEFPPAGD